jgi:DinB superfamily
MSLNNQNIRLLLDIIDQAYDHRAWHGTNLRGSILGLTLKQAAWRPSPKRHNIWEEVVHTAYWKYAVRRRILGEKRGSFPLKGSNWFIRPLERTESAWRSDVALLHETHKSLRGAIASLPPGRVHKIQGTSKYTFAQLIYGIASHDLYHAGQIQLLKKLQSV